MLRKVICIEVPKSHGEKAIDLLKRLEILNNELKIERNESHIYIPIKEQTEKEKLQDAKEQIPGSKILSRDFLIRKKHTPQLYESLRKFIPPHLVNRIPHSIDFIGDIAVLEIPSDLDQFSTRIGKVILETHIKIRTVLEKNSAIHGTYRIRKFKVIAGERKTHTIHKEHGCIYHVDLAKTYFSPRLSHEHHRVASLVHEGETIIDLFSGVGPFAILIAKTHKTAKIYAIDINPEAIKLLKKNIRKNKVENRIEPILGDAMQAVKHQRTKTADRVIMNLPEKAKDYIEIACQAIKPKGGVLHFYCFTSPTNTVDDTIQYLERTIKNSDRKIEKIKSRRVRNTAPHEYQVVFDVKIN
ncbi:MAG: class I SAM-dependent methyltransferase family protein [Candidatus Bathyarchaeota archaeon]|jgi:tRNA (guanine37-N1)-methyltransferase